MSADSLPGAAHTPDVLEEVDCLIADLRQHRDATVGLRLERLLAAIDAVHRTALTHLVEAIRGMAGDAFINRLVSDPAIRLLLMSYDLVAVDRRLMAEEALDTVRGPLHAQGIDVEITDVVGGVVYVRLHGAAAGRETLTELETALRDGFIGFQQLVAGQPTEASPLIPLSTLRGVRRPVFTTVAGFTDLAETTLKAVDVDEQPILLVRVDDEVYAVQNRCGDTPLPLHFGTLAGTELRCSWHGCRYDIRSGRRLDREGDGLRVFPVRIADGEIRVSIRAETGAQSE